MGRMDVVTAQCTSTAHTAAEAVVFLGGAG